MGLALRSMKTTSKNMNLPNKYIVLKKNYSETSYVVFFKKSFCKVTVGKKNKKLLNQICKNNKNFFFITPFNQFSKKTSSIKNMQQFNELKKFLEKKSFKFFFGEAIPYSQNWRTEKGFFVFDKKYLINFFLKKYKQNAVLYSNLVSEPYFIWNRNLNF